MKTETQGWFEAIKIAGRQTKEAREKVIAMLKFDKGALASAVRLRHTGINTEWDLTGDGRVDVSELQSAEAKQYISIETYARICNWLGMPMETFFREAGTGKEG